MAKKKLKDPLKLFTELMLDSKDDFKNVFFRSFPKLIRAAKGKSKEVLIYLTLTGLRHLKTKEQKLSPDYLPEDINLCPFFTKEWTSAMVVETLEGREDKEIAGILISLAYIAEELGVEIIVKEVVSAGAKVQIEEEGEIVALRKEKPGTQLEKLEKFIDVSPLTLEAIEKAAEEKTGGNIKKLARLAGINPHNLYAWMSKQRKTAESAVNQKVKSILEKKYGTPLTAEKVEAEILHLGSLDLLADRLGVKKEDVELIILSLRKKRKRSKQKECRQSRQTQDQPLLSKSSEPEESVLKEIADTEVPD